MTQSEHDKLYRQNNQYANLLVGLKASMQRMQKDNVGEMTRMALDNWIERMAAVQKRCAEISVNGGS